jgi:hypothetical protein
VLSREEPNTNFIVFGVTRSGLKPMIDHTRGEQANHYTTDAVHPEEQNNRVEIYHHLDGYINIIEIHRNLDEKQTRDIKNITIRIDHRREIHHNPDEENNISEIHHNPDEENNISGIHHNPDEENNTHAIHHNPDE